jgi:arabinogalactan oligomer/maltooligosaccharide transport system permease protein
MAGSTDILISWIFKLTLDQRMYNFASALSILIFIIVASVSAWNLLRTRAFKEE